MAKGRALKEEMMMKPAKDKQGFPSVPKEHKSMDDLGYFTKMKMKKAKGR